MNNKIRFGSTRINFQDDVGLTGQEHDDYPSPNQPLRFDHIRMYLIGLLSNQSSQEEPTQYREGTIWYDLTANALKIRKNDVWVNIASAIEFDVNTTLSEWVSYVDNIIGNYKQDIVFGGSASSNTNIITIPESLRSNITSISRAFVYVDGLLQDPRNIVIIGNNTIRLVETINSGSKYLVNIKQINSDAFYTSDVVI